MQVKNTITINAKQALRLNLINDLENDSNRFRQEKISKIKSRNYSGCKIRKISQW